MKTYIIYGCLWGLAGAVLTLALFFLGFHSDASKLSTAQIIGTVAGLIISVVFLVLGTKARRDEIPPTEPFGYGRALGAAMMVALFGVLFSVIFNFIYMQFINAGMQDLIMQAQIDKLEAKGLSSAQIEGAEKFMRMMMKPPVQAVMGLVAGLFFSLLISLVTSAFLKRPAVEQQPPVVA